MSPEIIDRDEFIVVGIRTVIEMGTETPGTLWKDQFLPRHNEISGADSLYYSVFNALPDAKKRGRFEYVAGVVGTLENIPEGMVGWIIPVGRYARIQAAGLEGMAAACRGLITDWLPDSGYRRVESPIFACTGDRQPDSPEALWTVHVPIETPEEIEALRKWHVGAGN